MRKISLWKIAIIFWHSPSLVKSVFEARECCSHVCLYVMHFSFSTWEIQMSTCIFVRVCACVCVCVYRSPGPTGGRLCVCVCVVRFVIPFSILATCNFCLHKKVQRETLLSNQRLMKFVTETCNQRLTQLLTAIIVICFHFSSCLHCATFSCWWSKACLGHGFLRQL